MSSPNIKKILVNKKSLDSEIFSHVKKSHPTAEIFEISTNTKATDPKYNLISLSWKDRQKQKRNLLGVLHRESKWNVDCNGRSTDFLPGNMIQNSCFFSCAYCYIDRHGPTYIKLYDDCFSFVDFCIDLEKNKDHYRRKFVSETNKDFERHRDPKHNKYITVDIGCDDQITISNRMTAHDNYHGHIVDIVNRVNDNTEEIMLSFASKDANFEDYAPYIKNPSRNRIRLSLMPEHHRKVLELNTSKIEDRIKSINYLVDMGFEVHVNLSPIVVTNEFAKEYAELLKMLDEGISHKAKAQMAYEIIFVTHDNVVNEQMSTYMPKAYNMIVDGPCSLEPKWNKPNVYSYSKENKTMLKQIMKGLIEEFTPYSRVRYMF